MIIPRFRLALLSVLSATIPAPAEADGMRCGQRLVSSGDTLHQVRSRCGEPNAADRRVETRRVATRVTVPCGDGKRCSRTDEVIVEVTIDQWTYDLGRQRFVRYLTFENGKLRDVETGDYGRSE